MSHVREDKPKNGPSTFSDQITSRLHRWVQRTTSKGRDREKGANIRNLRPENNHAVKDIDLNIKQCSPPPQKSIPSNKDTRTILELEKALKDLINNCVTNAASSPSGNDGASFVGDGIRLSMTTKYITKDNGDEVGSNRGETSGDDDIASVGWQTQKGKHGRNVDGALLASGLSQQNRGNSAACETTLVANPGATPGEKVGVEKKSLPSGTRNQPKDISKRKEHAEVTLFCETDEGNTKACEDRNHPSTSSSETTDLDTSVRNTNNGLSTGSSIKTQHRRISRSGLNALTHHGRTKTVDGDAGDVKNSSPKQKPPLRRIQSEGDSIAKRFSFNNNDVSEFAETCIRHAQRKRLSQANSLDSDADSLSDMVFGEAGQQVSTRPSPEFAVPRKLPLHSSARDSGNVSDFELGLSDTASRPSTQDALRSGQHSPLSDRPSSLSDVEMSLSPQCGVLRKYPLRSGTRDSGNVSDFDPGSPDLAASRPSDQHRTVHTTVSDRPSSLSFPLERNKAKNMNKQSFFKNKSKSKSEDSCSPQSSKKRGSVNSATFRKFPCQPVFYVPQPGESSSPLAIPRSKKNRSKSLTESKHGNSEHLI